MAAGSGGAGGGAGSRAVEAGRAFIRLFAMDLTGPGVKGAENRLKGFEDKVKQVGEKSRSVLGGAAGLGGGAFAPFGAAGAVAGVAVGGTLKALEVYQERLNKAIERGIELSEEFNAKFGAKAMADRVLGRKFEDAFGETDPVRRAAALRDALAVAEETRRKAEDDLNRAKDRADRVTDTTMQIAQLHPGLGEMLGVGKGEMPHLGSIDEANAALKETRKQHQEVQKAIEDLNKALADTTAADAHVGAFREAVKADEARKKSIDGVINSLKEQAATEGKTAAEIARHKLAELGATQEQIAEAVKHANELERLRNRPDAVRRAFRSAFGSDKPPAPAVEEPPRFATVGAFQSGNFQQLLGGTGGLGSKIDTTNKLLKEIKEDLNPTPDMRAFK